MLLTAIKMCCCNDFQEESERRHEDNRGVGVQSNVRNESTRKDKESRALFIRNHVVLKKVKQYFASGTEDDSGKETSVKFPIDLSQHIPEESDIEAQLQSPNLEEDKNLKNQRECDDEQCECECECECDYNFKTKSDNYESVLEELADEEQNGKQKMLQKKCSILVRSSSQINSNASVPESECSPTMCSICYQEYEVGEDICWSKNETCPHAFHVQCITLWLMNHDDCPMCRGTYLVEE